MNLVYCLIEYVKIRGLLIMKSRWIGNFVNVSIIPFEVKKILLINLHIYINCIILQLLSEPVILSQSGGRFFKRWNI